LSGSIDEILIAVRARCIVEEMVDDFGLCGLRIQCIGPALRKRAGALSRLIKIFEETRLALGRTWTLNLGYVTWPNLVAPEERWRLSQVVGETAVEFAAEFSGHLSEQSLTPFRCYFSKKALEK
jgi:hypothetical protein